MDKIIVEDLLKTQWSDIFESDASDEHSENSDDDLLDVGDCENTQQNKSVKIMNFIEDTVHRYSDQEFVKHFRLKRSTAYRIIDEMSQSDIFPHHKDGREKFSIEKSFLMVLWYLGNQEIYRQIEDRFNVSSGSVNRILRRVIKYFLPCNYIKWPTDQEKKRISKKFQKMKGFPDVIGAIDGSYIEIPKPKENQDSYCNRKSYHSLLLQGVVDSDKKCIDVYCGEPGSMNDARLLRKSGIYMKAQENPNYMGHYYLLGDSAYPNLPWLVTPFADNGHLTREQTEFNYRLSATRIVVENAFGLLKTRFRRLRKLDNTNMHLCARPK